MYCFVFRYMRVSIHAPPEGRDRPNCHDLCSYLVSIHAPPEGRDPIDSNLDVTWFQSTRPRRGATRLFPVFQFHMICFNPRAPGGARQYVASIPFLNTYVSIHAPPEGRDTIQTLYARHIARFNPRAPGGARHYTVHMIVGVDEFQSTRPRRGATSDLPSFQAYLDVSIHAPPEGRDETATYKDPDGFQSTAPGGARQLTDMKRPGKDEVSIHAPPEGRDEDLVFEYLSFQSTRPRRGATRCLMPLPPMVCFNPRPNAGLHRYRVSIHAPPEGRDSDQPAANHKDHVSIHAPPEGRDDMSGLLNDTLLMFQSTRPRRGATFIPMFEGAAFAGFNPRAPGGARLYHATTFNSKNVSIHAPPEGRDVISLFTCAGPNLSFNPRAPGGARFFALTSDPTTFQSTRPRRGATHHHSPREVQRACFNPRAPGGARPFQSIITFQSTRPRRGAMFGRTWQYRCFNPRAPGGARRLRCWHDYQIIRVSIHAPPEGRDISV